MANIRRTREQWQQLIDQQSQSELTINEYCTQHQITVSGFYQWRKKLNQSEPTGHDENWLSLPTMKPVADTGEWQIELMLPGGVILRMNPPV